MVTVLRRRFALLVLAVLLTPGCGSAATSTSDRLVGWRPFVHVHTPLDLAGPRTDDSMVLAAAGRLWLLRPSGAVRPFAPAYTAPGEEPYIAMAPKGCFGAGTVYALRLQSPTGVVAVSPSGRVRRFATITTAGLEDGIAFGWGKLLVTIEHGSSTTVDAISCGGTVTTITGSAPRVEGGIAVAPSSFGRFAGDLIAPDELSGQIFAITPQGKSTLVASSGLPHGGDIGVESEGFVPAARHLDALVADRLTPGNPHPGDDLVLRISSAALRSAGVRSGDLLVATEGGGLTDAIRCGPTRCQARHIGGGPTIAHIEGHIAFLAP